MFDERHVNNRSEGQAAAPGLSAEDYLILVQRGSTCWDAWSPDLPECVVSGESKDRTVALMRDSIRRRLCEIEAHGQRPPTPSGCGVYVEEHVTAVHWIVL